MKIVNMSIGHLGTTHEKSFSGENHRAEKPPMNPPLVKKDRFAPKSKQVNDPKISKSPVSSSIRGDPKQEKPVTNEDIMKLLLKTLNK